MRRATRLVHLKDRFEDVVVEVVSGSLYSFVEARPDARSGESSADFSVFAHTLFFEYEDVL